jgi:hypothetical protein
MPVHAFPITRGRGSRGTSRPSRSHTHSAANSSGEARSAGCRNLGDRTVFEPFVSGCTGTVWVAVVASFGAVLDDDLDGVLGVEAEVGGGCGAVVVGDGVLVRGGVGVGDGLGGDDTGVMVVFGDGSAVPVGSGWAGVVGCCGDDLATFAALGAGSTGSADGGGGISAGCADGSLLPGTSGPSPGCLAGSAGRPGFHTPPTVGMSALLPGAGAPAGAGMAPWMSVL